MMGWNVYGFKASNYFYLFQKMLECIQFKLSFLCGTILTM